MEFIFDHLTDKFTGEVYDIYHLDTGDYIKLPGIEYPGYHKILDFINIQDLNDFNNQIDLSDYPDYPGIHAINGYLDTDLYILIYKSNSSFNSICKHGKVSLSRYELSYIEDLIITVSRFKESLSYNDFIQDNLSRIISDLTDIKYPCYTCLSEY